MHHNNLSLDFSTTDMEDYEFSSQPFESDVLQTRRQPGRTRMAEDRDTDFNNIGTADSAVRDGEDRPVRRRRRAYAEAVEQPEPRVRPEISASATNTTPKEQPQPKIKKPAAKRHHDGPSAWDNTVSFFTDTRWPVFFGVILLIAFCFIVISSISYFTASTADQSMVHSLTLSQIAQRSSEISNYGGPLGAWVTDFIYARGFGIGSLALVSYVLLLGLMLVKLVKLNFWSVTVKSLIAAIAISDVCGLATFNHTSHLFWGGEHGYYLNTLLLQWSGIWGAAGVAVLMVTAIILIFLSQVKVVFGVIASFWKTNRENRKQQRERRLELLRQKRAAHEPASKQTDAETHDNIAVASDFEIQMPDNGNHEIVTEQQTAIGSDDKPHHLTDLSDLAESEPADPQIRQETAAAHNHDTGRTLNERYTPPVTIAESLSKQRESTHTESSANEPHPVEFAEAPVITDFAEVDELPDVPESTDTLSEIPVVDESDTSSQPSISETIHADNYTKDAPSGDVVTAAPIEAATVVSELYDPTAELSRFHKPDIDLLEDRPVKSASADIQEVDYNKKRITDVLNSFGIAISSINATVGPTITLYEIIPAEGVRINKIKNLGDDIALSLSALGIRIIAPMPGKGTIGIEVPNKDAQIVSIRSILNSAAYQESKAHLPMAMGATISNEVFIADLTEIPHLLVAGSTGTGKSVGLNTIIASILYKKHPAEVKFVLIDPKRVEFSIYSAIERHYLAKLPGEDEAIVTDMQKVVPTLNSLVCEMESRYELLKNAGVRNVREYNTKFIQKRLNPEKGHRYMPYIVVVIDEFADLIMTAGKEVENPIMRLAQMARAVGIHVILATQRPSANIITGVIRANFPGRIAFKVTQMLESRIILDQRGADQLVGRGDMLFLQGGKLHRVQCAYISTEEVQGICDAISAQPGYEQAYQLPEYIPSAAESNQTAAGTFGERDPLFIEAGRAVCESGSGSTSFLQRRLELGYPRAGKIMDQLEKAGVVGPAQGGKPRQVLMSAMDFELSFSR